MQMNHSTANQRRNNLRLLRWWPATGGIFQEIFFQEIKGAGREGSGPFTSREVNLSFLRRRHCCPRELWLPHSAWEPHRAWLPHNAWEPHRAWLPDSVLLDAVAPVEVVIAPVTNCRRAPHGCVRPGGGSIPDGGGIVGESHFIGIGIDVAMGDIAVPFATTELLRAASTST